VRWVFGLIVLALVVVGAFWWQYRKAAASARALAEVKTAAVTRGDVEKTIESSGTVAANLEVEIKCRASGEIVKLPFDISDVVKKGDILCQLDPTDEKLAVRSAEADLAQTNAKLKQAKSSLREAELNLVTTGTRAASTLASAKVKSNNARAKADRQKQLVLQQLGSQEESEAAESEAAASGAELSAAEVALEEIKQQEIALESRRQDVSLADSAVVSSLIRLDQQNKQLDYTTVVSPMDGTVSTLNVQKGTIVASGTNNVSGGTTIMTLADLSRLFVSATVDEADIGGIKVDQPVRVRVDSYPGQIFEGKVVRVAVKGVSASNVVTFEVKVEVSDAQKHLLKPLMTASVSIVEQSRANVPVVPVSAIHRKAGKPYVKLEDGVHRDVTLGVSGVDNVEIVSGLTEGEKVIVDVSELPSRWRTQTDEDE